MSLLKMNHIQKGFDGLDVLKDISVEVDEGGFFLSSDPRAPESLHFFVAQPCWKP